MDLYGSLHSLFSVYKNYFIYLSILYNLNTAINVLVLSYRRDTKSHKVFMLSPLILSRSLLTPQHIFWESIPYVSPDSRPRLYDACVN